MRKPIPPTETEVMEALRAYGMEAVDNRPADERALEALDALCRELRRPPTAREVADRTGIPMPTVGGALRKLSREARVVALPVAGRANYYRYIPRASP